MSGELKNRVATGVAWNISEKIGSMLLQLAVSLIVANILMPEDFGVMAILTFFTSIALVVVDSGFSQTLIRKANPTEEDFGSVFAFNLLMSAVLYIVLTAIAPFVARFYDMPAIAEIAPVLFLLFPINALGVIQNTLFTRQFRFDLLSRATFASSFVGGVTAVAMAMSGCGVWSLVGQRLATSLTKSAILWIYNSRPPVKRRAFAPIREMSPFSLRLLATDIVSSVYNNLAQMFIGKIYSDTVLGYFNEAQKLKDLPVTSTLQSVQSVTYPALSKIGDDSEKFAESYRQVLMAVAFLMFPMMAGLAAVADDMILLCIKEKWMPTVPYLRILCLTGFFAPLAGISLNILKVKSDGRIIFNLELIKKVIMTAVLLITVMHSVKAVAWGLVAVSFSDFIVNLTASTRYTSLTLPRVVRTLLPTVAITAAMYASVILLCRFAADVPLAPRLLIKIVTGIAVYTVLALVFRLEAAREVRNIAAKLLGK